MKLSLRWRLTLFYGALLSAILLLTGVGVYYALKSSLNATLDSSLRDAATLAASQLVGDETDPKLSDPDIDAFQARVASNTTIVVYDQTGTITDRIGKLRFKIPLEAGYQTLNETRVFTQALPSGGWVQALRGQVETLEILGRVQRQLLIALPTLILLGLTGGYLIADRALAPVDQVSRLATKIAESGQYQARVPPSLGQDEMARLTRTVNAMLERLEATIERERTFALAAAHELRTPLSALRGRASLLLTRPRSQTEYQRATEEMLQTSVEMTELVDRLLTLARSNQAPERSTLDLSEFVSQVAATFASQADIQFHFDLASCTIKADPQALRLLVSNLLDNAIKYGNGNVWLKILSQENYVGLEICDDGAGIPSSQIQRLQQPFQRGLGMQAIAGAGLGLALVAAVVMQHGGRLEFSQATQGGLRVQIDLPSA